MKPEEPNSSQSRFSPPQRGLINSNSVQSQDHQSEQDAAAGIIRSQIDNIFETQSNNDIPSKQSTQFEIASPYHRNHAEHTNPQENEWKKYHTAWQTYYKNYYEGYYSHSHKKENQQSNNNDDSKKKFTTNEAVFDLRQEIIGKVQKSAVKVKKSRHFIPILSGLAVILIFAFLQYNRLIFANVTAFISPGNIDPQNIIVSPSSDLTVPPESKIIIPKINVDVPVTYGIGNDYNSQMAAMSHGLAHFSIPGASSRPGQIGNTVISGHSSNDLLEPGDYKFIFAQLDKLNKGDTIYTHYKSKRYTYIVTKKEVVKPNEINKLVYQTNKPVLTLITCTPLGTAISRLLVTAEQISPDPSQSKSKPIGNDTKTESIPGNPPTFFERLFTNNY